MNAHPVLLRREAPAVHSPERELGVGMAAIIYDAMYKSVESVKSVACFKAFYCMG